MTVYADSLFLVNLLSEYILLVLSEKIASVKANTAYRLTAAIFGAAISTAVFCTDIPISQSIMRIITAFLTICIAYIKKPRAVIRAFPAFLLASFLYSGIISATASLFPGGGILRGGFTYIRADTILFIIIFLFTYPAVLLLAKLFRLPAKRTVGITVSYNGKSVHLTALFDSGNLLTDGNQSVIIAEWDIIKALFDTECFEDLYGLDGTKILPFGSLGGTATVLIFYADAVSTDAHTFTHTPIGIINRKITTHVPCNALIGKQYVAS